MTTRRRFFRSTLGAVLAAPFGLLAAMKPEWVPLKRISPGTARALVGEMKIQNELVLDLEELSRLVAEGIREVLGPPDLVA